MQLQNTLAHNANQYEKEKMKDRKVEKNVETKSKLLTSSGLPGISNSLSLV